MRFMQSNIYNKSSIHKASLNEIRSHQKGFTYDLSFQQYYLTLS